METTRPKKSRPLINLIDVVPSEENLGDGDDVDYFEDSLATIFNDARNQHGDPGQQVLYRCSDYFGKDIKLRLADPKKEDNKLFAHFLWNVSEQKLGESGQAARLRWGQGGERER